MNFAAAVLLTIGLSAPLVVSADDHDRDRDAKRYYDKSHKDYHQWNDNEDRNFGMFLSERHIQVHEWHKSSPKEQQEYWKWRHEHPDEKR